MGGALKQVKKLKFYMIFFSQNNFIEVNLEVQPRYVRIALASTAKVWITQKQIRKVDKIMKIKLYIQERMKVKI